MRDAIKKGWVIQRDDGTLAIENGWLVRGKPNGVAVEGDGADPRAGVVMFP